MVVVRVTLRSRNGSCPNAASGSTTRVCPASAMHHITHPTSDCRTFISVMSGYISYHPTAKIWITGALKDSTWCCTGCSWKPAFSPADSLPTQPNPYRLEFALQSIPRLSERPPSRGDQQEREEKGKSGGRLLSNLGPNNSGFDIKVVFTAQSSFHH